MKTPLRSCALICSTLLAVAATAVAPGSAWADTSPVGPPGQPASCQHETYPPTPTEKNGTADPYAIPFTASLGIDVNGIQEGGYLQVVGPTFTVTLGGPVEGVTPATPLGYGQMQGTVCGLVYLPQEAGGVYGNPLGSSGNGNRDQNNNNFLFTDGVNGIPVTLSATGIQGIPLISGYGAAEGNLTATFVKTPATNGGIDVDFSGSAKATAVVNPTQLADLLANLTLLKQLTHLDPELVQLITTLAGKAAGSLGSECTLTLGDLQSSGASTADLSATGTGTTRASGNEITQATGLTYDQDVAPVTLTTGASSVYNSQGQVTQTAYGDPVTGPITSAQAGLVSINFPLAKVLPDMPPAVGAPNATEPATTLCNSKFASLFDSLLGLPSAPGKGTFFAQGTFAIHTSA
jgi:hypothetical protein